MQHVTHRTHLAGLGQEVSGDRLIRAVLQLDAGQIGEVLNGHAGFDRGHAIDERGAGGAFAALLAGQIVLIANIAHKLLGHILKRHDAVRAAVLVDDHGQMDAALTQQFQARQQLGGAGQGDAFAHHIAHDLGVRIAHVQQIAHMHEADHVVEILAGHRVTGVRLVAYERGGLDQGLVALDEDHVGARAHHLGDDGFGRIEHIVQNRAFVLGKVGVGADQHAQLVVGHLGLGLLRVEAEQADDAVRVLADEPDDRAADGGEGVDGGHHGARDLLGALHGDALGHHLGDHDGAVGDDEGQDDVHQAAGDAGVHTPAFDHRNQVGGDGRGAERGGQEAGERHADLHGGEEGVRVTCDFGDFGAASVLLLHLLDLRAAQRDQCQLGAGEHGTDNEKYKNQEDVQTK